MPDRYIGTTANDRTALAKAVKGEGDRNRQRLAIVFGPDAADRVIGTTQREAALAGTRNQIVDNAVAEFRRQAANELAPRQTGALVVCSVPWRASPAGAQSVSNARRSG